LPVALIAALIGGSVGALVMHRSQPATAETTTSTGAQVAGATTTQSDAAIPSDFDTSEEQIAYKTGFADGFTAADNRAAITNDGSTGRYIAAAPTRTVYRNRTVTRRAAPQRVYYDYNRPQSRSFWSKHRDKLTMAIGTGAGAAIGGLIGGKKGAAIGALSGLGGSALYTYKLRNRNRSN
jgi:YMGG-like Gly-zipper